MTDTPIARPVTLLQQLERTRFERALEVCESLAVHRALLTTMELERMSQILMGKQEDPWRTEPVTLTLPSGKQETLALHENPRLMVREKLHIATELAENGHPVDAAVDIYISLVLAHPFKDGNRRAAVLAAHYFLRRYGSQLSGMTLHELGLGDLRDPEQVKSLRETVRQMARFRH